MLLLLLLLATPSLAEPIDPSDIRVIDGDTIRVYHQQPNVRLVGFNAPETRRADCTAEFELGSKMFSLPKLGKSVAAAVSTVPCSGCLATRILISLAEQSGWTA